MELLLSNKKSILDLAIIAIVNVIGFVAAFLIDVLIATQFTIFGKEIF